ncbi:MAG TPA: SDR family oxidoreductase [Arenibaculum sp.]|nr:SDR family oxidoreductase [Arenibaculum sp.]
MERSTILVTGGTGFLGSHFLLRLLARDERVSVFAPVGAADADQARDRLFRALERAAEGYRPVPDAGALAGRVVAMPADPTAPGPGLGADDLRRLEAAGVGSVWHVPDGPAADVAHAEAMVDLAASLGAGRFVLVSTADVAGRLSGDVGEEPVEEGREFRDARERAGAETERRILERCRAAGPDAAIVRPSVVVGPSATKATGGGRTGLYRLIRYLYAARGALARGTRDVRFGSAFGGTVNFIPVDAVADGMWELAREGFPGGPIFHLVGGIDVAARTAAEMVRECLGLSRLAFTQAPPADPGPLERRLERGLGVFRAHAETPRHFLSARTCPASVSEGDLLNFVSAAVRELEFGTLGEVFERAEVTGADGVRLVAYATGDRSLPALVCCNAYGMPAEFWLPLARSLRGLRRIVLWETRGLPGPPDAVEGVDLSVDAHVRDMTAVARHFGVDRADVAGWSTGAVVAAKAAVRAPGFVRSLLLLNGSFMLQGTGLTPFQKNMKSVMPKVAINRKTAQTLFNIVFGGGKRSVLFAWADRLLAKQADQILGVVDPRLQHLTGLPVSSADASFRYARLVKSFIDEDPAGWLGRVEAPTLVFTCRGDVTAHPEGSSATAARIPGARLHVQDPGDHFAFYADERARAAIVAFLDGSDVGPPRAHAET